MGEVSVNREIKFRVWNDDLKLMADWEDVRTMPICEVFGVGHLVPELWTGLKGRDGKDVYEGDIVADEYEDKWVVEYDEGGANFEMIKTRGLDGGREMLIHMDFDEIWDEGIEVVGNIHESPTPD